MTTPSFVVVGHTCIDINKTPKKETKSFGGAGYFSALAASRAVQPVGLVTRVGGDYDPRFLFSHVESLGVHVIKDKATMCSIQTYHSASDLTDRDIEQIWGVGPDICPDDFPKEWYTSVVHVHLATMPPSQQKQCIDLVRTSMPQATLSIDTDLFLLKDEETIQAVAANFTAADIVFSNRREYEILRDVIDTCPMSIVKLDGDGAYILSYGKKIYSSGAPKVDVVDTTGAGDIFAGTFLANKVIGKSDTECLQKAIKVASESVTHHGIEYLFASTDK